MKKPSRVQPSAKHWRSTTKNYYYPRPVRSRATRRWRGPGWGRCMAGSSRHTSLRLGGGRGLLRWPGAWSGRPWKRRPRADEPTICTGKAGFESRCWMAARLMREWRRPTSRSRTALDSTHEHSSAQRSWQISRTVSSDMIAYLYDSWRSAVSACLHLSVSSRGWERKGGGDRGSRVRSSISSAQNSSTDRACLRVRALSPSNGYSHDAHWIVPWTGCLRSGRSVPRPHSLPPRETARWVIAMASPLAESDT